MRKIKKVLKERKKRVQYEHSRRVYAFILVIDFFVATLFAVAAQKSFADKVPAGSYLQSCRDVWVENNTLHASCQTRAGNWVTSGLGYVSQCRDDISNQDGHLRCNRGATAGGGAAAPGGSHTQVSPPRGSYLQSCRDVWVANDVLHASCQTRGGNWVTSVLRDFSSCHADIENQDGQLRCTVR
jgi:hypothetical protein